MFDQLLAIHAIVCYSNRMNATSIQVECDVHVPSIELNDTAILAILKEQFNSMSIDEKTPYAYIMEEAKMRLSQHADEIPKPKSEPKTKSKSKSEPEPVERTSSKKRSARELFCDENMPALKRKHADLDHSKLLKLLQADWRKLSAEEKKSWTEKAKNQKSEGAGKGKLD